MSIFVNVHTIVNVSTRGYVVKKSPNLVNLVCEQPLEQFFELNIFINLQEDVSKVSFMFFKKAAKTYKISQLGFWVYLWMSLYHQRQTDRFCHIFKAFLEKLNFNSIGLIKFRPNM